MPSPPTDRRGKGPVAVIDAPKDEPTLADLVIREWSRSRMRRIDKAGWIARTVASARKFVLDETMSAFLADLGYGLVPRARGNEKRIAQIMDGYRQLARLPHPVTWVEWDTEAFRRRAIEQWAMPVPSRTDDKVSRTGWLFVQHPKADNAVLSLSATLFVDSVPLPIAISQTAVMWSVTDEVPPWPPLMRWEEMRESARREGLPPGVSHMMNMTCAPWISEEAKKYFLVRETVEDEQERHAYQMRFKLAFLAAINDCPVQYRKVLPTGHQLIRGNYKRFVEHTIISLTIPKQGMKLRQLADQVLRATRRRAHMVRGHFRRHHLFPLNPLCEHEFEGVEASKMLRCKLCEGRKMWVAEHQAGDAALGWVMHDYRVGHKPERLRVGGIPI